MVLSVKSEKADRLARELAALTGESITNVVITSLEARLELERKGSRDLRDIIERFSQINPIDHRPPDVIVGYDSDGLPS